MTRLFFGNILEMRHAKGCLYGSRDWTFAGTGLDSGSRHVYVPIIFIALIRLHEAGRFSSRPAYGGSRFQQPGSRLKRDDFCLTGAT